MHVVNVVILHLKAVGLLSIHKAAEKPLIKPTLRSANKNPPCVSEFDQSEKFIVTAKTQPELKFGPQPQKAAEVAWISCSPDCSISCCWLLRVLCLGQASSSWL